MAVISLATGDAERDIYSLRARESLDSVYGRFLRFRSNFRITNSNLVSFLTLGRMKTANCIFSRKNRDSALLEIPGQSTKSSQQVSESCAWEPVCNQRCRIYRLATATRLGGSLFMKRRV